MDSVFDSIAGWFDIPNRALSALEFILILAVVGIFVVAVVLIIYVSKNAAGVSMLLPRL